MTRPNVLILQATGTNRDGDAAEAITVAGGAPEILHVNELRESPDRLHDFQMLVLPGGFSYGDALGAGRLLAIDMRWLFQEHLARFVETGKPVLGICNGFQALVKSGWLPGPEAGIASGSADTSADTSPDMAAAASREQGRATLTRNVSNRFECRWVWLEPNRESPCVFTRGLSERITCPVAHGEGRFVPRNDDVLASLRNANQIALTYTTASGGAPEYPDNPNGSTADIAGICNVQGTVFGLMPHPEDHIYPEQHPRWTRGQRGNLGLSLLQRGVAYAAEL
ncbi:MAG: phosphoribosylformylglycinamidine synthase I [Anaerolineae bacterium]